MNDRPNHLFRSAARALAVSAIVAAVAAAVSSGGVVTAADNGASASTSPPTPVLQPSHPTATPSMTKPTAPPECRELTLAKADGGEKRHAVVCDLPETGSGAVRAVVLTVDCRATRMWPAGGLVLRDPVSRRSYLPDCLGGDDRVPGSEKTPKPSFEPAVPPCGQLVVEAGADRGDRARHCLLDASTIITLSRSSLSKILATTHYRLVNGAGREVEIRA